MESLEKLAIVLVFFFSRTNIKLSGQISKLARCIAVRITESFPDLIGDLKSIEPLVHGPSNLHLERNKAVRFTLSVLCCVDIVKKSTIQLVDM